MTAQLLVSGLLIMPNQQTTGTIPENQSTMPRVFADTNLFIYAESADGVKTERSLAIIENKPVISVQVINETISVLTRKHDFTLTEAHEVAESLLDLCEVVPLEVATIREAIGLTKRYSLSHWDSLIVAAALRAGCDTLYSEDMQHGQIFDGQLTVVNSYI